jgi:hypothetical protein
MSIKIIDKGLKSYLSEIDKIRDKKISVGILAEDGGKSSVDKEGKTEDITLFEKAKRVEFGIGQPKRTFMRVSYEIDEKRITKLVKKLDKEVFAGNVDARSFLDRMGQEHTNTIKTTMKNGREHFQLNSREWAREKGKPQLKNASPVDVTPTIYSGQTRQAINFKVHE